MKKIIVQAALSLICYCACGLTVTPSTTISLLTCGTGNEVYSMYGHTALRIKDSSQNVDAVINYGIFSMADGDFVYKFVKGETDYMVAPSSFGDFMDEYNYDKRSVYENVLNLSDSSKQRLFDYLAWNLAPEHRVYRYKYYSDNCATRIRDLLDKSCVITWNKTSDHRVAMPADVEHASVVGDFWKPGNTYSFRDMIVIYQQKLPWIDFGIHLPMATPSDYAMDYRSVMFLPDFLMDAVQNARVVVNGVEQPLARPSVCLLFFKAIKDQSPFWMLPPFWVLVCFITLIATTTIGFMKGKLALLTDVILLTVTGLMGLLLFYLSFFSVHEALSPNFNLWWAFPVHLVVLLIIIFYRKIFDYYSIFIIVLYGSFFVCVPFLKQSISVYYMLLPLVLLGRQVLRLILKKKDGITPRS